MAAILRLNQLMVTTRLGYHAYERAVPQQASVDVVLTYAELPSACQTDEVAETYCYDQLATTLKTVAAETEYQLIERLAYAMYECLRADLNGGDKLWLQVTKVHPPVKGLQGGASFSIGEL